MPLLARLPLDPETRVGGRRGHRRSRVRRPDSAQARAFRELAAAVTSAARRAGRAGAAAEDQLTPPRLAAPASIVPIFPLPDVTFFPHTLLPLHVFEARYRAMVIDALARDRRLAVVQAAARLRGELRRQAGRAPGGRRSARSSSCERLATGRYNILLRGECARAARAASCRATRSTGSCAAQRLERRRARRRRGAGADAHPRRAAGRCSRRSAARPTCSTPRWPKDRRPASIADRIAAAVAARRRRSARACSRRSTSPRASSRVGGGARGARRTSCKGGRE